MRIKKDCPKCKGEHIVKSGIIAERQRYKCLDCKYHFTVMKDGRSIDPYYVIKALQLYLEGLSYREIERLLGVSHVSVKNWVASYNITKPASGEYHPTYHVFSHAELVAFISDKSNLKSLGSIITELGDKFMLIKWERFRK